MSWLLVNCEPDVGSERAVIPKASFVWRGALGLDANRATSRDMIDGWLGPLVRAGLLCAVVDLAWAIVLTRAYGGSVLGLFQRIAATPFGPGMFEGGWTTGLLGLALHFVAASTRQPGTG